MRSHRLYLRLNYCVWLKLSYILLLYLRLKLSYILWLYLRLKLSYILWLYLRLNYILGLMLNYLFMLRLYNIRLHCILLLLKLILRRRLKKNLRLSLSNRLLVLLCLFLRMCR